VVVLIGVAAGEGLLQAANMLINKMTVLQMAFFTGSFISIYRFFESTFLFTGSVKHGTLLVLGDTAATNDG
jgi:hypothetical protein